MTTVSPPDVSVVIPTYRGRDALRRSLPPLVADPSVGEIIVIVDGLDDGSVDDLRRLSLLHRKLRWEFVPNGGEMAARDRGAELARGEVVLFLDQDVVAGPGLAHRHARLHAGSPHRVVVGYMPTAATGRPSFTTRLYARDYERRCRGYETDPESILTHLWGGNFSLRRSDCLAIRLRRPGFAQRERYHSDRELGLRCKQHGLVGVFDRSLRATHLHERDRAAFLQDSRSQGSSLARLHQLHSETLGPLHLATLAAGLPFPLRWLVAACRLPAVERVVETGLLGVNRLASAAGASETELATGKLLRRIGQQRGALWVAQSRSETQDSSASGNECSRRGSSV